MYASDTIVVATPIGAVAIGAVSGRVVSVRIGVPEEPTDSDDPLLRAAARQLAEWFTGTRTDFDLPLVPAATERGAALRQAICDISYGTTERYGEIARRIASAPRAVGQACARNPLPILVPCHRVLAAGGAEQYSGGDGVATKRWLLDHERRTAISRTG